MLAESCAPGVGAALSPLARRDMRDEMFDMASSASVRSFERCAVSSPDPAASEA